MHLLYKNIGHTQLAYSFIFGIASFQTCTSAFVGISHKYINIEKTFKNTFVYAPLTPST